MANEALVENSDDEAIDSDRHKVQKNAEPLEEVRQVEEKKGRVNEAAH